MSTPSESGSEALTDGDVRSTYETLLRAWNDRDAARMAGLFGSDGVAIGFDGSEMRGPGQIANDIGAVFRDHETARYVHEVREVRLLAPGVGLLRATVGMIPAGTDDINPDLNAIQTLVVARSGDGPHIVLFQNTPLALHGRPEAREEITDRLRRVAGGEA